MVVPGFVFLLYTLPHCINIFILLMFREVMSKYSSGALNYSHVVTLIPIIIGGNGSIHAECCTSEQQPKHL